ALPRARPLLGDHARGRPARLELLAHALEVRAFVASGAVERALPPEPLLADRVELARELEDLDPPEAREDRFPVHLAPQGDALFEAPPLDEVPGGVEAVGRVEDALHQRREREHPLRRLAVRRAQLDVALEAHLGKERGEVQVPVVERRAMAACALAEEAPERD